MPLGTCELHLRFIFGILKQFLTVNKDQRL